MKLLVFGQTGQVAQSLMRLQPDAVYLGRDQVDLSHPEAIAAAIAHHAPDAVINAAAYTAVDKAETERDLAMAVNGTAPGIMASACHTQGAVFVHVSTDYVFDGMGDLPFAPDAPCAPQNHYGVTKLAGEAAVQRSGAACVVLRTSWVFSAFGANFVKTMLRLAQTRDQLSIVADQHGGPTPAAAIAQACLTIAHRLRQDASVSGVHHFSGSPDTTWADFAQQIFAKAGRTVAITPIRSADYPTPARRPLNSRLNCDSTTSVFGIARPDWRAGLDDVLTELEGQP